MARYARLDAGTPATGGRGEEMSVLTGFEIKCDKCSVAEQEVLPEELVCCRFNPY